MKRSENTGTLAAIAAAIEIVPGATRVQLFPGYGTIKGRNGAGPYILADQAHAERVIAATAAAQGPVDLHFDYDHQAALAPGVAGTSKAAAWFTKLTADADCIWAEDVQWTAAASAALEAKEYRYASPYFLHDKQGRITRVINAALTNTPNFNLAALASSTADSIEETPSMEDLVAIAAALGLPATTTRAEAVTAIGTIMAAQAALTATASALGVAADADGAAIASAATTLKANAGGDPDPTKFVPVAHLKAVTDRLETIDGERAEAAIASAIKAGKLAPAQRDWALGYFKKDQAAFASFIGTAPVILAPGSDPAKDIDLKSDVLTSDERAIASSLGLTPEAFLAARKEG